MGAGVATALMLLAVAASLTGVAYGKASTLPVRRELIGRSVRGRPIYVYRLGRSGGRPVLVVGCVDGDEPAGIAIVTALRRVQPPTGVDLWLLPTINPDGL